MYRTLPIGDREFDISGSNKIRSLPTGLDKLPMELFPKRLHNSYKKSIKNRKGVRKNLKKTRARK